MKLSVMLTPPSDRNLKLAKQAGAEGLVIHYPGLDPENLLNTCRKAASFGLQVNAVERLIPHSKFVHNLPGRDEQIADFIQLIRNMGKAGIPVLCYNWMPRDDWGRTRVDAPERGGALVTEFDLNAPMIPRDYGYEVPEGAGKITPEDELWENLQYFLERVLPVAEAAGVKLAMHPDDPPLPDLYGQPCIMVGFEAFERLVNMVPSPSNTLCFCQGTFSSQGDLDIFDGIRRLGPHISFVHFRDVMGAVPKFRETFIDNGKTDMAKAMKAYMNIPNSREICIRPDHVPTMEGETNENPGYEMLGRLHAIGYMTGLMHAVESFDQK
jgi:mannonate dehydratase